MVRKNKKTKSIAEKPKVTHGPRVTDIFVGDSVGEASSIIRLPQLTHLNVVKSAKKVGVLEITPETAEEIIKEKIEESKEEKTAVFSEIEEEGGLVFHLPKIADIPEAIDSETLKSELDQLLGDEDKREKELSIRAATYRNEKRISAIEHSQNASQSSSGVVHSRMKMAGRNTETKKESLEIARPQGEPPLASLALKSGVRPQMGDFGTTVTPRKDDETPPNLLPDQAGIRHPKQGVEDRLLSGEETTEIASARPSKMDDGSHLRQCYDGQAQRRLVSRQKVELKKEKGISKEKSKDGEDLLRTIMQRDVAEGYVPFVAPPVAWSSFRSKTKSQKKTEKKQDENPAEKVSEKKTVPAARQNFSKKVQDKTRRVKKEKVVVGKKNFLEAGRVAFAVMLAGMVVGLIASVSAAPRLAKVMEKTAGAGATQLAAGLKSIAGSDVEAGKKQLDEAASLFADAQKQLDTSTSASFRILAKLDPKDRLNSGEKLLSAGKKLSALGGDAALLVSMFHEKESATDLTGVLTDSLPLVQKLSGELESINGEIKDISVDSLPGNIRDDVGQLQTGVRALNELVSSYLDSHEVLLELLGARQDRQFLFVFENNRELRPGGGFIGSFALADVKKGVVKKVQVDTIYNPDGQLRDFIVPPLPLQKITDRWFTRDANWFADFRLNAKKISALFERSGGPTVDGVIAITPTVLEQLLRVTGPISMPAYDVTVNADNVVDETQRLVTFDYDKEKNKPKEFLGDLMPEVLNRINKLPNERWGELLGAFSDSLKQKQILVWLRDQDAQKKVDGLNWGGAVEDTNGDYLMRVEANIGGHKTDELIEQSVKYDVSYEANGQAMATLITTRHHSGSKEGREGWNPDEDWYSKPNVIFERTLVPKGSTLLEASGFTKSSDVPIPFKNNADYQTYTQDQDIVELEKNSIDHSSGTVVSQEGNKTSFGNWIVTAPGDTTVTIYRYRLPAETTKELKTPASYSQLVQKQPGHQPVKFEATVRVPSGFRITWGGPENGVTFDGTRKATFTGILKSDMVWGVVIDKE
jgi:hypothetical protein